MWFYAGTNTQRMCDTNSPKQMLKHRMMCDIMWHHKNACGVKNFHNNLHHSPPASLCLRWDDINEDFRCLQLCKDTRREIKIKPETQTLTIKMTYNIPKRFFRYSWNYTTQTLLFYLLFIVESYTTSYTTKPIQNLATIFNRCLYFEGRAGYVCES